jgi:hypothetical protein
MSHLTIYRTTFEDVSEDGELVGTDTLEETQDCTPDSFDLEDGLTAVDLAAQFLADESITETSTSPIPATGSMAGIWFSYVDGSYVSDYYTGERTEVSAHPEGFTDDELRSICRAIGAREK